MQIFVLILLSSLRYAVGNVQYHHLRDWRLCNNGEHPQVLSQVFCQPRTLPDLEKGDSYRCDRRVLDPEQCRAVVIAMSEFSASALTQLVPNIDDDVTVRRIIIKLATNSTSTPNIETTGKEIDNFIRPRLWWYVSKEPCAWNSHAQHHIVFSRVQQPFEPSLHVLAALQYPSSAEICEQTPLLLNHRDFKHPGWYSMLVQYTSVHEELPYAITAVYVSSENSVHDSTSFITADDCPHEVNKWECAFLALTNCTLPELVTHCKGHDCVQKVVTDTLMVTAIFNSTSAHGASVHKGGAVYERIKKQSMQPLPSNDHLIAEVAAARKGQPQVRYQRPFYADKAPFQSMMFAKPDYYTHNLVLRPSAFYRSRISEAIHNFQVTNNFTVTDRCVAAQIRRGDRANVHRNITEFCKDPKNRDSDMGCNSVPFVSITLQHVVDSAAKLVEPSVRSLIVTTDDEEWLEKEKVKLRETHPEWRVYSLKAPHHTVQHSDNPAPLASGANDAEYTYMRYGAGTASGVLLHGSIELSRQCEAFVGHFGCGGTMLVYKSLCAQHGHLEFVCPPAFDLRTISELQIKYK